MDLVILLANIVLGRSTAGVFVYYLALRGRGCCCYLFESELIELNQKQARGGRLALRQQVGSPAMGNEALFRLRMAFEAVNEAPPLESKNLEPTSCGRTSLSFLELFSLEF